LLILKFAIRKATTGIDSLYFTVNATWKPDRRGRLPQGGPDFK